MSEEPDDPAAGDLHELPLDGVLDLHGFRPADQREVVASYLDAAWEAGLAEIRIIHGKGIGVQREAVRALLTRDPRVAAFGDAPAEAGSWGATLVTLRR